MKQITIIYSFYSRYERFKGIVDYLGIQYPVAEIATMTGYSEPSVSQMINNKRAISDAFLKVFCEKYKLDYSKMRHGNIAPTKSLATIEKPKDIELLFVVLENIVKTQKEHIDLLKKVIEKLGNVIDKGSK